VSQTQLGQLKQVAPVYTDDSTFQHQRDAEVAASASPSPPPAAGAILEVPYTVQAPFGNWKVHEESCEEVALLMYREFLLGDKRTDIPPAEARPRRPYVSAGASGSAARTASSLSSRRLT